jgi:hypothetical protein
LQNWSCGEKNQCFLFSKPDLVFWCPDDRIAFSFFWPIKVSRRQHLDAPKHGQKPLEKPTENASPPHKPNSSCANSDRVQDLGCRAKGRAKGLPFSGSSALERHELLLLLGEPRRKVHNLGFRV